MYSRVPYFLAGAVASAVVLVSCGSDADPVDGTTIARAAEESSVDSSEESDITTGPTGVETAVLALDNNFRPEMLEIDAGTTVIWENGGRNDHNIFPTDDSEEWGVDVEDFAPGDVYSNTFTTPGEYAYYCTLHGTADFGMIGTIVVNG